MIKTLRLWNSNWVWTALQKNIYCVLSNFLCLSWCCYIFLSAFQGRPNQETHRKAILIEIGYNNRILKVWLWFSFPPCYTTVSHGGVSLPLFLILSSFPGLKECFCPLDRMICFLILHTSFVQSSRKWNSATFTEFGLRDSLPIS